MSRVRASSLQPARFTTASVGSGCLLDSRRALFHEGQGWLAVADVHFGYELNRTRNHGALLPQWGMAATEERLLELLRHYEPRMFVIVGDVMDGGGSIRETMTMLERLRALVPRLICVEGNHDRTALKRGGQFVPWHDGDGFVFQHGHRFEQVLSHTVHLGPVIHVTGHEHPAIHFSDGAGLSLKLPAFVQDRVSSAGAEQWILPAFSPWAGGGIYENKKHERIAAWACGEGRILRT